MNISGNFYLVILTSLPHLRFGDVVPRLQSLLIEMIKQMMKFWNRWPKLQPKQLDPHSGRGKELGMSIEKLVSIDFNDCQLIIF
jgi:hypothetical protein